MSEDFKGADAPRRVRVEQRDTAYAGYLDVEVLHLRHGLYAGGMSPPLRREIVERGAAVAVLPYDPVRDEVVLVEQFRVGAFASGDEPWLLEIIAGIVEPGEDLDTVARREAREEAGLDLGPLEFVLSVYTSPGVMTERVAVGWCPVDATAAAGVHGLEDEGEDIRVVVMPFAAAWEALEAGTIRSAPAALALQWLALNRERLRRPDGG